MNGKQVIWLEERAGDHVTAHNLKVAPHGGRELSGLLVQSVAGTPFEGCRECSGRSRVVQTQRISLFVGNCNERLCVGPRRLCAPAREACYLWPPPHHPTPL